jgi:hypothetical protein
MAIAALCAGRAGRLDAVTNAPTKTKTMNISGTVKAVSGNTLTVTAAGKDMTFTIDKRRSSSARVSARRRKRARSP